MYKLLIHYNRGFMFLFELCFVLKKKKIIRAKGLCWRNIIFFFKYDLFKNADI